MIDAFEPDFLVPMTDDLTAAATSSVASNRVVPPKEIFSEVEDDDPIALGVSAWEVSVTPWRVRESRTVFAEPRLE